MQERLRNDLPSGCVGHVLERIEPRSPHESTDILPAPSDGRVPCNHSRLSRSLRSVRFDAFFFANQTPPMQNLIGQAQDFTLLRIEGQTVVAQQAATVPLPIELKS